MGPRCVVVVAHRNHYGLSSALRSIRPARNGIDLRDTLIAVRGRRGRCSGSGLRPRRQRRPDTAQRLGVVGQLWAHGGGEGEVFRGGGRIPGAGEGKAEAEVSVVVTRDCLHVPPEVVRRLRVPAGIELCPGQGLADASGARLCLRGTFE